MRITADTDVCIGSGNCTRVAPDLFDQDEDGFVTLLNPQPDPTRQDAAREAEDLCPSGAIAINEDA